MEPIMDVISIFRGDSHIEPIFATYNRAKWPLNGLTICFMVKKSMDYPDSRALISKTITVPASPAIYDTEIALSDNDTRIPVGDYVSDILLAQDGRLVTRYNGRFIIKQRVRT